MLLVRKRRAQHTALYMAAWKPPLGIAMACSRDGFSIVSKNSQRAVNQQRTSHAASSNAFVDVILLAILRGPLPLFAQLSFVRIPTRCFKHIHVLVGAYCSAGMVLNRSALRTESARSRTGGCPKSYASPNWSGFLVSYRNLFDCLGQKNDVWHDIETSNQVLERYHLAWPGLASKLQATLATVVSVWKELGRWF